MPGVWFGGTEVKEYDVYEKMAVPRKVDRLEERSRRSCLREPAKFPECAPPTLSEYVDLAKGVRKAKELAEDLEQPGLVDLGWPIIWTPTEAWYFVSPLRDDGELTYLFHREEGISYIPVDRTEAINSVRPQRRTMFLQLGELECLPEWDDDGLSTPDKRVRNYWYPTRVRDVNEAKWFKSDNDDSDREVLEKDPAEVVDDCEHLVHRELSRIEGTRNSTAPALAASADVIDKWLMDTGCGHDLVARKEIKALAKMFRRAGLPLTFSTANGQTHATLCLPLHLSALGEDIEPYVLDSTPAVLSVGKRCRKMGYSFIWLAGKSPVFITPSLKAVVLEIVDDIPYLRPGNDGKSIDEIKDLYEQCGIKVNCDPFFLKCHHGTSGMNDSMNEIKNNHFSEAVPAEEDGETEEGPGNGADQDGESDTVETVGEPPAGEGESPKEDELPPKEDTPSNKRPRRDLVAEALTLEHHCRHKPYNKHCPGCVQGRLLMLERYPELSVERSRSLGIFVHVTTPIWTSRREDQALEESPWASSCSTSLRTLSS